MLAAAIDSPPSKLARASKSEITPVIVAISPLANSSHATLNWSVESST